MEDKDFENEIDFENDDNIEDDDFNEDTSRGYSEVDQQATEELYEHYKFIVDPGQGSLRIDKYLTNKVQDISRNRIQSALKNQNVLVNDIPVKSNYKIKPDDEIRIVLSSPPRIIKLVAEEMDLDIRFEDMDLLIVNKPPNLVVHPAYLHFNGTLLNGLKHHVDNVTDLRDSNSRALLIHRIDKDTSGLLVVAKNEFTQEKLSEQFFYHTIERRYIALVWGNVKEDEGTIVGNIGRSLKDRTKRAVFPNGDYGKYAVTHYKVIERLGYVSVVECKLETGRTHQIRVHMKHIGHPVFSDGPYGGKKIVKGTTFTKYKQFVENCFKIMPRQALHAKSLGFIHPKTKSELFFEVDLPDDMRRLIKKWRDYKQNY